MVGENGGGLFVLVYVLFLLILGVPILTMEYAIGRSSRLSVLLAFKKLEPKNSKWHVYKDGLWIPIGYSISKK